MSDRVVVMHERRITGVLPRERADAGAHRLAHDRGTPTNEEQGTPQHETRTRDVRRAGGDVPGALASPTPDFLGQSNAVNTSRQISMLGIFAIGIGFVIVTGGIDLSVGSVIGLTGVIIAKLSSHGDRRPGLLAAGSASPSRSASRC